MHPSRYRIYVLFDTHTHDVLAERMFLYVARNASGSPPIDPLRHTGRHTARLQTTYSFLLFHWLLSLGLLTYRMTISYLTVLPPPHRSKGRHL